MKLRFSQEALQQLTKIDKTYAQRIVQKLEWYVQQEDPLQFARPLSGFDALYRFRVGKYRILVTPDGTVLVVLRIAKRSSVYRELQ